MLDQPQSVPTQSSGSTSPAPAEPSNTNRINALLQDLAAQRAGGNPLTPTQPRPMVAPPDLPTGQAGSTVPSPTSPSSVAPMPSRPEPISSITPPPRPIAPPPAPREMPVQTAPMPPRPPTASAQTQQPASSPITQEKPIPQKDYTGELRTMSTDIGNIKIGQAPASIKPQTEPSAASETPITPAITIPSAPSIGGKTVRKMVYGILAALVLIVIVYGTVSFFSGNQQTSTATPSPSASTAPISGVKNLRSYFGNPASSINLKSTATGKDDLLNALASVPMAPQQAVVLSVQHMGATTDIGTFFNDTIGEIPANLKESFADDWSVLAYGQTEQYDSAGAQVANTATGTRIVVLAELSNASQANQAMQIWETSGLASASSGLMQYDISKSVVAKFSNGVYRQIPVRYWNFPYADRSMDYAIVTASNNKNYLIISGSREALFFIIDQLMQ